MPAQPNRTSSITNFFVYAVAVVALIVSLSPNASAQTIWTISVDVTSNADRPLYMVLPDHGGCMNLPHQNPENLYVCPGDTVQWDFSTMGKHGLLTIHQNRGFQNVKGIKDKWFRGTEGGTTPGVNMASVTIDGHDPGNVYEYCLAIYDNKNGAPYVLHAHDPKIIIGGTPFGARLAELQEEFRPVLDEIAKDSKDDSARRKAIKINEEIEKLKKLLQK